MRVVVDDDGQLKHISRYMPVCDVGTVNVPAFVTSLWNNKGLGIANVHSL